VGGNGAQRICRSIFNRLFGLSPFNDLLFSRVMDSENIMFDIFNSPLVDLWAKFRN